MNIHILCNDGSPIGIVPEDVETRGVGGAELALLSLADTFASKGHFVTIYNNPKRHAPNQVAFAQLSDFKPEDKNRVLIVFRSPNGRVQPAQAIKKIWWSTDQYTIGDFSRFHHMVDKVITISPFHTRYHVQTYRMPPDKVKHIDLGVRINEYDKSIPKIRNRLIFCSIPDRGLMQLHAIWALIAKEVPDASLVITSDYRLWGLDTPNNHMHRLVWTDFMENVQFLGRVSRSQLVKLQREAEILAYPCIYEELFCVSVAECQVAGAYPVTSGYGALTTTNQFGTIINGIPTNPGFVTDFTREIVELLTTRRSDLAAQAEEMQTGAAKRFSWDRIYEQWMEVISE